VTRNSAQPKVIEEFYAQQRLPPCWMATYSNRVQTCATTQLSDYMTCSRLSRG
jgi:hypothetical protein